MARGAEPELEMVRRIAPYGLPAAAAALLVGTAAGGWNVGWSAAIGISVVFTNFVVNGISLARAARVSLLALYAVAMIGFVVRMAAILALMFGLNAFSFFSPLAFGLAVVPSALLLLAFEMKLLAGGLGPALHVQPDLGGAKGSPR